MIIYKVVEKRSRRGTNWILSSKMEKLKLFNDESYKKLKPYFPQYRKGRIVKAVPKSTGILCFKTENHAKNFINGELRFNKQKAKIIKLRGIGNPKRRVVIMGHCSNFLNLIGEGFRTIKRDNPAGTIAFNSVEVLQ